MSAVFRPGYLFQTFNSHFQNTRVQCLQCCISVYNCWNSLLSRFICQRLTCYYDPNKNWTGSLSDLKIKRRDIIIASWSNRFADFKCLPCIVTHPSQVYDSVSFEAGSKDINNQHSSNLTLSSLLDAELNHLKTHFTLSQNLACCYTYSELTMLFARLSLAILFH
jgi:hypothetical protein